MSNEGDLTHWIDQIARGRSSTPNALNVDPSPSSATMEAICLLP
ncbi:hypothetical protein GRAN_1448 [Granulicella sibirica]|uniref:Uncharacterized protein n=1 Tax=Granulicella sibirica TaxID=2479048 RepID=A0A4Q0T7P3_9BACT|nr:hypothetical protein GRAN_1448 [Granulicella sibirica]